MELPRTKEWREATGHTQRSLASASGVSLSSIVRIEKKNDSVSPRLARQLAEAMGISVADLMEKPPVPLGIAANSSRTNEERRRSLEERAKAVEPKTAAETMELIQEILRLGKELNEPEWAGRTLMLLPNIAGPVSKSAYRVPTHLQPEHEVVRTEG